MNSNRAFDARASRRRMGVVAVLAAASLLLAVAPSAFAARGHLCTVSFGGPGTESGELSEPVGLAVSEVGPMAGDVYVVDRGNDRVEIFNAAGTKVEGEFTGAATPAKAFEEVEGIAVDNSRSPEDPSAGDVYVIDYGNKVLDKFSPAGVYMGQITGTPETHQHEGEREGGPFLEIDGVAVDTKGQLWIEEWTSLYHIGVDSFSDALVNVFHEFTSTDTSSFDRNGLAVDAKDDLYLRESASGQFVSEFTSLGSAGPLLRRFEPESGFGEQGIATERLTEDVYLSEPGSVLRYGPVGLSPIERLSPPGLVHGAGVAVDSTSGTVYVADASADVVHGCPLEPPGTPHIESEGVSEVTAESATFKAEVNPRSEPGEPATTYHFEYTTEERFQREGFTGATGLPVGSLPADYNVHAVEAHVQGLQPRTAYQFRVLAGNAHSSGEGTVGVARQFVTQPPAGEALLPDGRVWELVSPPDKLGALIDPITETGLVQAAANGDAITYVTDAPTESEPDGYGGYAQILSTRAGTGSSSWVSKDISPPQTGATGLGTEGKEFRFFSEDLSSAVLQPFGAFDPHLSTGASEQTAFLRNNFTPGAPLSQCAGAGCYVPLVAACPAAGECEPALEAHADVPPGTRFSTTGECPRTNTGTAHTFCGPEFLGATPNLTTVVFGSEARLPAPQPTTEKGLYEWSSTAAAGEALNAVSILPSGQPAPPADGPQLGSQAGSLARNAISTDGSRVIWSERGGGEHLYEWDRATGRSVQLDAVQGGNASGPVTPLFQTADVTGSRVFFTDQQRLTGNSGGGDEFRADLYECDIVEEAAGPRCELTDLTPINGTEPASVQDFVLGASTDGQTVYFVADGVLAPGASSGNCKPNDGPGPVCNLYVRTEGQTRFVTQLSGADKPDFEPPVGELAGLTARVTPDGGRLVFMSRRSLTGYDNTDAVTGRPDEEVFEYTLNPSAGTPALVCVSCNPTGERPLGVEYSRLASGNGGIAGGDRVWENTQGIAASVPGWTPYEATLARYQSRYLSEDGRLFFNSSDALVPQDVNGTEDVYEYEPPGVGNCSTERSTFSQAAGGCVSLISSGTSHDESAFLDASETGGDVFFLTTAKLSSADYDASPDVYDAHECGAAGCAPAEPTPSPPCVTAEACRAAVSPQPGIFGAPASATFAGAGDPPPTGGASGPVVKVVKKTVKCKKGLVKNRRGKCLRKPSKRKGKAKKSVHTNGRAGR